jgi:penicillin-binding protein 2
MELTPQTELTLNKTERLPLGKLHAVQYVIAAILVILSAGLWRLEVVSADNFRALAEANRIR